MSWAFFRGFSLSYTVRSVFLMLLALSSSPATSQVFFQEDFEANTLSTAPNPVWSWPAPDLNSSFNTGMMFGSGDLYSISNTISYTGSQSLRLTFDGRNNWCNTCGARSLLATSSDLTSGCFSASGGPYNNAVFDKDDGFSQWRITSSNSSTVCVDLSSPVGSSLLGRNIIKAGDEIKFPLVCGVNGNVGGAIDRRSDCNKAINYLNGISKAHFPYGKKLSRRFYLFIPSTTTLPDVTLKLGYAHFYKNGSTVSNTLKLSVQRGLRLELTAPGGKALPSYQADVDQWYYFEEVFTRESSSTAQDGSYELYVSPANQPVTKPVFSQYNIQIGELIDMSFNGNFQHYNDAKGSIYFDAVLISDRFAGPVNGNSVSPPNPPTGIQ